MAVRVSADDCLLTDTDDVSFWFVCVFFQWWIVSAPFVKEREMSAWKGWIPFMLSQQSVKNDSYKLQHYMACLKEKFIRLYVK